MPLVIKNRQVTEDRWQQLATDAGLQDALRYAQPIVPFVLWQAHRKELAGIRPLGVWLDADTLVERIVDDLQHFALVALDFPKFTDGRHFSSARLLRERHGYRGEIRATGDVFHDQLLPMSRCGFDAFVLRSDCDPYDALRALDEFSDQYQASVTNPLPLFRRRTQEQARQAG
mgnify:CR=1 FL=1